MGNKRSLFLFFFCLYWSLTAAAQNPHPYFRNYNTDHGLPSSEVHYALQDDDGYMWFATDNGLSHFDGYTFKNYGHREGLKDNVIFHLQKAPDGKIWMLTMSGALFFVEGDSIIAYAQNEVIRQYRDNRIISDFLIDSSSTIYLSTRYSGILQFKPDGSFLPIKPRNTLSRIFVLETKSRPLLGQINIPDSLRKIYQDRYRKKGMEYPIEWCGKERRLIKGNIYSPKIHTGIYSLNCLSNNTHLLFAYNHLYQIIDYSIVWDKPITYAFQRKAVVETDGGILVGTLHGGGLRRYKSLTHWQKEDYEQFLEGKSITHIFKDKDGAYWISTIEHGVFYCPDFDQQIYDRSFGFPNADVRCMAFKNEHEVYIGFRKGGILLLNTGTKSRIDQWLPFQKKTDIAFDLYFDKNNNCLWAGSPRLKYRANQQWNKIPFFNQNIQDTSYYSAKHFSLSQDKQSLWYSSNYYFGRVNIVKKKNAFNSRNIGINGRAFISKESKNGQIWIGRADGLFEFKNEELIQPSPFYPAFTTRIDDIDEMADSTLVICTKGEGVLLWKDSFFLQFTTQDGLLSDMIENVHIDKKERIWIGTLQGLNRIIFPKKGNYTNAKIERFTVEHGLPSNEINQVQSYGDQVWIATTRGLMKWQEPRKNTSTKPPVFKKLRVNNQVFDSSSGDSFAYRQNNFRFEFVTINYKLNGNIPYRYRMNSGYWSETKHTNTNFSQLSAGLYLFEVQSQNEDGLWSDSAVYRFSINAPWWQQWWFYTALLCVFILLGWAVYKYRIRLFKKEYALKDQIKELEKKALQAQMNPHFIFNCLTSIQRLVMDKETDNAMRYLSRFAKLIRGTLNASVLGEISLEEEIEMLESYLQLEKLRFKSAFDYSINTDPTLDVFETTFPSMLLQPYVENAIVHGMQNKESGGQITINFRKEEGRLVATISDNGGGMQASSKLNPLHKSVGMSITSHRLKLLHNGEEKYFVQVFDIIGKNKEVQGIKVKVIL